MGRGVGKERNVKKKSKINKYIKKRIEEFFLYFFYLGKAAVASLTIYCLVNIL